MRRLVVALWVAALVLGTSVTGQETIPPISVGAGSSGSCTANGQTVEVIADIPVTVYFTEISSTRVTGIATRGCSGTCAGNVSVRWVDVYRQTNLSLSAANDEVPFGMENGDVDKKGGHNQSN